MIYPRIDDPELLKKIRKKFPQYKFTSKVNKMTLKELCKPPVKFTYQLPQLFLSEFINPKSPYRGILVFHKIGSGKTCTAVNIAQQWKGKRQIIVVVPASLIGNFRDELRSPCAGNDYLTRTERQSLATLSNEERHNLIQKSDERIDKYYKIYSYNKFIELLDSKKIKLQNTLLIIDEIQNMVSDSGSYYKKLKRFLDSAPTDLRTVLLSATPIFDKPSEIALTLNLLPIPDKFEVGQAFNEKYIETTVNSKGIIDYNLKNEEDFKQKIRGFVSYYRGMPEKSFPRSQLHIVKCTMEPFQYRSYRIVLEKENKLHSKKIDILKLPNDFFIGSRIISNIAFPNRNANEEGFESWRGACLKGKNLKKYSIKFYKIMKRIKRSEGKVFVYSAFLSYGGLLPFAEVLKAYGYKDYKDKSDTDRKSQKYYAVWSGDETLSYKEEIKYRYNQKDSNLSILIGSPAIKEGVSLKRCRQVHILEPYWNFSRLAQIIGRAIRYCSHADMPYKDQWVDVYLYIAQRPNEKSFRNEEEILERMSVDRYINHLALTKQGLTSKFEKLIMRNAVDCLLNDSVNGTGCDV